jgi:hypothetical protein
MDTLKLIDKISKQDEKKDVSMPVENRGKTIISEKSELLKTFQGLTNKDDFLKAIVTNYENEKDINMLKNQIFGIVVLLLNLESVIDAPLGASSCEKLPMASGTNEFQAASTWYKPQGFLRGNEKEIDNFVRHNVLKDEKSRQKFLLQVYYILRTHMARKEKENKKTI